LLAIASLRRRVTQARRRAIPRSVARPAGRASPSRGPTSSDHQLTPSLSRQRRFDLVAAIARAPRPQLQPPRRARRPRPSRRRCRRRNPRAARMAREHRRHRRTVRVRARVSGAILPPRTAEDGARHGRGGGGGGGVGGWGWVGGGGARPVVSATLRNSAARSPRAAVAASAGTPPGDQTTVAQSRDAE